MLCQNASPALSIPNVSITKIGMSNANSTAAAPRSSVDRPCRTVEGMPAPIRDRDVKACPPYPGDAHTQVPTLARGVTNPEYGDSPGQYQPFGGYKRR